MDWLDWYLQSSICRVDDVGGDGSVKFYTSDLGMPFSGSVCYFMHLVYAISHMSVSQSASQTPV